MDIGGWLRSLGLERYEAAFRENEIEERVLPSLTQEDLKEIGVGPVGHRRRLLDAIAALRTDAGARAPSAESATASAAPSVPVDDRAERRQVTVMFADLVGSTALSARMDPDEETANAAAGLRSIACKIPSAATSTGRAGVETASILATLFAVDAAWTVLAPQRPNKTATDRFRPWQDTPLLRLS
jgi:class 3 adenylate cyclase